MPENWRHIVHSPPRAGKGCESQLLYSVKDHFYFRFLNVLFPDGGIIFNAGAAHSVLSRSRTSWRQHDEICSFQNSHHSASQLMVLSWAVFLNCSPPSLMWPSRHWPSPQHGHWSPTFSCSQFDDYCNFVARQLRIRQSEVSSVTTEKIFWPFVFIISPIWFLSHTLQSSPASAFSFLVTSPSRVSVGKRTQLKNNTSN